MTDNKDCEQEKKPHPWEEAGWVAEAAWDGAVITRGGKHQGEFTVSDYADWPENERVELIDGYIIRMEGPSVPHQMIQMAVSHAFVSFIREYGGDCVVLPAGTDVQLDRDEWTMLQPDISVFCDREKLNWKNCFGEPDLVVEILSPSTARKDGVWKRKKYVKAGVRELWLIDPVQRSVTVWRGPASDQMQIPKVYTFEDTVPVGIWDDRCLVDFSAIAGSLAFLYRERE